MSVFFPFFGWIQSNRQLAESVCTEPVFRAIVAREQRRCNRTGGMFVLVAFPVGTATNQATHHELMTSLNARLRATDAAGLINGQTVLMLPETSPVGAEMVAKEIWAQTSLEPNPQFGIFIFPESVQDPVESPAAISALLDKSPDKVEETGSVHQFSACPLPRWKRAFDIVASSLGMLLVSPIMLAAAVAIKFTSPGPLLFTQLRTGHGGRRFKIYKLRTMTINSEAIKDQLRNEQDGPAFKMENDPRVTTVGRYLRKTAIDELPQLWNVFIGDMTMVGPRPLACSEADQCTDWQNERLRAMPGLTCTWQSTSGRSRIPFRQWMQMDIRYARSSSLWQDVKLIFKTIYAVIRHRASC
ncbi:MAG: sugar transferase [Pirellulaceae bacterium]